jgi:4'-phosphopantetheinyl transferase EntD
VIEEILPAEVVSVDTRGDEDIDLFPAEREVIARSVDSRRREFTTARACARRALAGLGIEPVPILPGPRGAPRWPPGVVGSMTHCAGYRAAVVARADEVTTLGVDAEPHGPLPDGVAEAVTIGDEPDRLRELRHTEPRVHWDRVLFSAKESVYKAWFPLTGRWLGFEEAVITLVRIPGAWHGTFTGRLLIPGPPVDGRVLRGFSGRWLIRDGLVITAICLRQGDRADAG